MKTTTGKARSAAAVVLAAFAFGAGAQAPAIKQPAPEPAEKTGVVKMFNDAKGYGLIAPDDKGADVFFHFTAIQTSGFQSAKAGQKVTYELLTGPKGTQARNVRVRRSP